MDEVPAHEADVLIVEFQRPDFDRSIGSKIDPSLDLIRAVANWYLLRLRAIARSGKVREVSFPTFQYRIEYLNDDRTELLPEKDKLRGRSTIAFEFSYVAINAATIETMTRLPLDFELPAWRELLLEANEALPNAGGAFVLCFAALEAYLNSVVGRLCDKDEKLKPVWAWMQNRDPSKYHSVADLADTWLKLTIGQSLKNQPVLWEGFQRLRKLRNDYVHRGSVQLSDDSEKRHNETIQLMNHAHQIIDFVEALLPEAEREWKPTEEIKVRVQGIIWPGNAANKGVEKESAPQDSSH